MEVLKRVFAVILAVVIGLTASVNAFAASARKTYISDIIAVTAKDENDAKTQLEKEGYTLLGGNVNSTLKTGVYLGYKETENAEEAITDIAGMNMTGKFSYADYESIMEQNKERIRELIADFLPVISEFQTNYEEEKPAALAAYKSLNIYKNDSGKLMGDYLLEYDFSDEAEKKLTEDFMHANSQIILAIMEQTSFAGDDGDESAVERMVETGPDGIAKKFKGLYPSVAKANQAMAAEYGGTASEMLKDWNSIYDYIGDTEENLIRTDKDGNSVPADGALEVSQSDENSYADYSDSEKKAAKALDSAGNTAEIVSNIADMSLYDLLRGTEYGDGTLLDFFNRPANEVKKEELYPLVDALSEGQRSAIGINGLRFTLESAFSAELTNDSEKTQKAFAGFEELVKEMDVISINYGVDQSVFEDGVAYTSAATEHETTTGESWLAKLGVENEKNFWLVSSVVSTFVTGVLVATCVAAAHTEKVRLAAEAADNARVAAIKDAELQYAEQKLDAASAAYVDFCNNAPDDMPFDELSKNLKLYDDEVKKWQLQADKIESRELSCGAGRAAGIIKCVSFVLLVVALAVDIYTIYEYITTPEASEEKIPHHLMTTAITPYGEDYVYYQTVKNLKGEAADTNNHEADAKIGWLMLYTTKDKVAGDPILAENLKLQTGSANFKEGTSFVHLFNETSALNLTAELYTGVKDSANGTYLVFNRDASTLIGSAITNGTAAIIGAGGLAVGAILGALIARLTGKKKKKENAAA